MAVFARCDIVQVNLETVVAHEMRGEPRPPSRDHFPIATFGCAYTADATGLAHRL